ncbi:hypothetical protein [Paraburkholderia sp. A2WS-5]
MRSWLRQTDAIEPKYPKRVSPSVVDEWAAQLTGWRVVGARMRRKESGTI